MDVAVPSQDEPLDPSAAAVYRKDYRVPDYQIDKADLIFFLDEDSTVVKSALTIRRTSKSESSASSQNLVLQGQGLTLKSIAIDGGPMEEGSYRVDASSLTLFDPPDSFVLSTEIEIKPQLNTELEGLYRSEHIFCTQCEAEGFRKITYFLDRPDVLCRFRTTLVANSERYPVLLSNGNAIERGRYDDGRHWVTWDDPFPKPCYLFALVAGDLDCLEDSFQTASGRRVALQVYVDKGQVSRCDHAVSSLKKAMRWDERTFGLEYDLDIYMIVAVRDFNMGAMENKGLNVFNSKFILADQETATDADYQNIEAVVAHEYFHNWTGNRVTCRDWFQLSLKEGLTVFREQRFCEEMTSRTARRIEDVRLLRSRQFSEDAGPMSHPVRPDSYLEMNNFYTVTIYEKGAEVVRMYETILGKEGFLRGMNLYFERHDGQAVTCDDFAKAMADANGWDCGSFMRWYSQPGTPEVVLGAEYDSLTCQYRLYCEQRAPAHIQNWQPQTIPIRLGLISQSGETLTFRVEKPDAPLVQESVVVLNEMKQSFLLHDVKQTPVPSLLRNFSSPIKLDFSYTDPELANLMANDLDSFNRWDAAQRLYGRAIASDQSDRYQELILQAMREIIQRYEQDPGLTADLITLPSLDYLAEQTMRVDYEALFSMRRELREAIAFRFHDKFLEIFERCVADAKDLSPEAVAKRRLKNLCLEYLVLKGDSADFFHCRHQYQTAASMTERMGAWIAINDIDSELREEISQDFYARFEEHSLVLDKWFAMHASSTAQGAVLRVKRLLAHPKFALTNPNRARSLLHVFATSNLAHFHDASGEGYALIADQVLALDKVNPQVAARLARAFDKLYRLDEDRMAKMREQLERIMQNQTLSKDTYEVVHTILSE